MEVVKFFEVVFLAWKVQNQIFGYLSPSRLFLTASPFYPFLPNPLGSLLLSLPLSSVRLPFPCRATYPHRSAFPLSFPISSPPSHSAPLPLCVCISLSVSNPPPHLLSDPTSQVNIKVASGRPRTSLLRAQDTLGRYRSLPGYRPEWWPLMQGTQLVEELGSARGCGAYSNAARCCCDSQGLSLHMVMRGGVGGGAEGRGGEDGGEGGVGGGSGTARSAAGLGQSTRTRGSGGSGATHPPPQHPLNQQATEPPAPGVSHSAHTAVTVTVQMLQVTTMSQ